ncbi:EF-hand domain-containing protein [Sphingomicrobium sp. XHP0239]|uniref:EF-hand domain-containing protein n=1 Tax=Sphingomicrobium maritimum TaxID=3133972 RepID=UPI0031CCC64E
MSTSPDPLTSREREVLAGILDHKTAKEMALELGISHHAVEKRLKRARQKLGADTSLDAARLHRDRYGRTVSGSPDLEAEGQPEQQTTEPTHVGFKTVRKGTLIMTTIGILAAGAYAFFALSSSPASQSAQGTQEEAVENALTGELGAAAEGFARIDLDGTGYIERDEFVPASLVGSLAQSRMPKHFDLDAALAESMRRRKALFTILDGDEDGRIDKGEYEAAFLEGMVPRTFFTAELGDFAEPGDFSGGEPFKYSNRVAFTPPPGEDLYDFAFARTDRDSSGAIELNEFLTSSFRSGRPTFQGFEKEAREIFAFMDRDEDGRVTANEFATVSFTDDAGNEYLFEVVPYEDR